MNRIDPGQTGSNLDSNEQMQHRSTMLIDHVVNQGLLQGMSSLLLVMLIDVLDRPRG